MTDTGKPALPQGTRPLRTSRWLFVFSGALVLFRGGVFVGHYKTPPYETLRSAKSTIQAWKGMWDSRRLSGMLRDRTLDAADAGEKLHPVRLVSASTLIDPVLLQGGLEVFTEHCPGG